MRLVSRVTLKTGCRLYQRAGDFTSVIGSNIIIIIAIPILKYVNKS